MTHQQAPYSVQLDPETARNLATHGATILLLDVPLGMPIGVDQQVFLTGPKFKGMKMLPPGAHFLSYQSMAKDGALSPPVSTFLCLKSKQVVVRRWNAASEGFEALADEDEEARYAAGVSRFDFDRELAPYDLNRYSQWVALSCHVTEPLLQQLLPADGEISIMSEAVDPQLMSPSSAAERRLQQQLEEGQAKRQAAMEIDTAADAQQEQQQLGQQPGQPQQQQQQQSPVGSTPPAPRGGRCQYSHLPRLIKLPGTPAAQLTALNMDKTSILEQVMARYSSSSSSSSSSQQVAGQGATSGSSSSSSGRQEAGSAAGVEVVGELQFAFIAFVFGQSLEGYLQWKQLLVLLLSCVAGPLGTHSQLFVAFLAAITVQLQLGLATSPAAAATAALGGSGGAAGPAASEALLGCGLVDELLPDSFLRGAFRGFFEMLQESAQEAPAAVVAQARVLESLLASGLGWDFRLAQLKLGSDDEDDDDGPVVVELTEQQLAELEAAGT